MFNIKRLYLLVFVSYKEKWPNAKEIQDILVRMIRKPGSRQHLGFMGRKESGKTI